ncbi:MAG TPA: ArsA-related P-loop ATPase, partial [Bacillota bacterium]
MKNLQNKITFIGGKGGVGKSSIAAAIAWKAAQDGEKTLLISTDPAHNLGDLFERTIGGQITQLMDNLFALEIDPERETEIYIRQVKENIKGTVHATMMEEVNRQLDTAKA